MAKLLVLLACLAVLQVTVAQDNKTEQAKGLSVTCTSEYIEAVIDMSVHTSIQPDSLTLEDKNCKISKTDGQKLYFKTALDGCGTKHNTTDKEIVYFNSIFAETNAGSNSAKISRQHQAEYPFKCTFPRSAILSVVNFSPRRKVIYSRTADYGNFTFEMDLYKTDKYEEAHKDYPIEVQLNSWLYVQTSVSSNDSKLALFNERCWATPSTDSDDKEQFVFLDKGCQKEKKEDMEYKFQKNKPKQNFQVRAFRFLTGSGNTVYLHCRVEVCRQGDKDSGCSKGCEGVDRRRRRSLVSDASSEVLTVGVIKVAKGDNAQPASAGNASSLTTISIVAGILAVLVVALVVVLAVVYKRRQAVPANVTFKKVAGSDGDQLMA